MYFGLAFRLDRENENKMRMVIDQGRPRLAAPPVRMIKLTETREVTPYKWVHPDEDR